MVRGQRSNPRVLGKVLTCQKDFELPVVELRLFLGQQAALGALSHRVDEAHAGQHHLLAAAFIAETAAAAPTVMLQTRGHNRGLSKSGTERCGLMCCCDRAGGKKTQNLCAKTNNRSCSCDLGSA